MARTRTTPASGPDGDGPAAPSRAGDAGYTVVARRYRPQRFEDVVGQDHVVRALRNAIKLDRVAQAYLFSGTRGVGKTSMARIFAKCLNCARGPTDQPCNECDICKAISIGQDVDVIEIDGASNNGVEAVRELRQNAGLRPSRARFKIYYIDEVHMLSTGAFNALLKTLEEPPGHVKFFFATTEPNKIPVTVLSRCQRYDFAGIGPEQIAETLAGICRDEGVAADRDALQAVARRAGGSMRDAQSLLEQLLSFGGPRLTAEVVYQGLGIAPDDRVLDLIDALADRDPARALTVLDQAVGTGVQPVELLNGAIEFLRDLMVLAAGAAVAPLAASPSQRPRLEAAAGRWSLDAILAALQVLAEARGRLRGSPHGRIVVESALCRVARLEDFAELGELLGRLHALETGNGAPRPGSPPNSGPIVKKKLNPAPAEAAARGPTTARDDSPPPSPRAEERRGGGTPEGSHDLLAIQDAWADLVARVGPDVAKWKRMQPSAIEAPNCLVIGPRAGYNWAVEACDQPEVRAGLQKALGDRFGGTWAVRIERPAEPEARTATATAPAHLEALAADPLVQDVVKLFEARAVHVEAEDGPEA